MNAVGGVATYLQVHECLVESEMLNYTISVHIKAQIIIATIV